MTGGFVSPSHFAFFVVAANFACSVDSLLPEKRLVRISDLFVTSSKTHIDGRHLQQTGPANLRHHDNIGIQCRTILEDERILPVCHGCAVFDFYLSRRYEVCATNVEPCIYGANDQQPAI